MRKKYGFLDVMSIFLIFVITLSVCMLVSYMNLKEVVEEDTVYATFTNAFSGKKTVLSEKSDYGKVSSKDGTISYWLYDSEIKRDNDMPSSTGVVRFFKDGSFIYDELGENSLQIKGYGKFDFQKILEKNREGRKYLNIKFANGTYKVGNMFRLYSHTKVWGESKKNTVLVKQSSNPVFVNFDDVSEHIKKYKGVQDLTIRNLKINCYDNEINVMHNSAFLYAAHGKNLVVNNVSVTKGTAAHCIQLTSMKDVTITYCDFKKIDYIKKDDGYKRMSLAYCKKNRIIEGDKEFNYEAIQIESDLDGTSLYGYIYSCPTARLSRDDTPSKDIRISKCTFDRVIRAIGNHTSRSENYQKDITIAHNTFKNVVGDVLKFPKYNNIDITYNYFANISSDYIGGKRIRVIESLGNGGVDYSNMSHIAKKWADNNYYLTSAGKYNKISNISTKSNSKIRIH